MKNIQETIFIYLLQKLKGKETAIMQALFPIVSVAILAGFSPNEIAGVPCKGASCRFETRPAKRSGIIVV